MAERAARSPLRRILLAFGAIVALLLISSIVTIRIIDTDVGRAWLVRQIERIAPDSGLTISIGRIDGSLYSRLTIHDLRLGDPQGVFLIAPQVDLDWRPSAFIRNQLRILTLDADFVRVLRPPKFRKTRPGPLLPSFDIYVGRLTVDRILFEPPIAGRAHDARLSGSADIRGGRAFIRLDSVAPTSGDRVAIRLDAEPDRDRFDVDAWVHAPAPGVLTGLLGLKKTVDVQIAGDGRWAQWRGSASATVGTAHLADLRLTERQGRFALDGQIAPALAVGGVLGHLTTSGVMASGTATLADRRLNARVHAHSEALDLDVAGTIDLADGRFENMRANARLLRSEALIRTLHGRDVRLTLMLDGPFARPTIDYALTSPALALGRTLFHRLRIAGRAEIGNGPVIVPMTLTAARVTGNGPFLESLLTNIRVNGPITVHGLELSSNALQLRSDRVASRAVASLSLRTGAYTALLTGKVVRYLVAGVGLVDIAADLRVVPAANGRDPHVTGRATARVMRLDNPFFRWLLEGLPTAAAHLDIPPDGTIRFTETRLTSPALQLAGNGIRAPNGTFTITAAGRSMRYGPIASLHLVGPIDHPKIDLILARPGFGIGLADVRAIVTPAPEGWAVVAQGRTAYGPAALQGRLITRAGQPLVIDVARLDALGLRGQGALRQIGGSLIGTLGLSGPGLDGTVRFMPAGNVQRLDFTLRANNARLALDVPIAVRRGSAEGTVLLYPDAPAITTKILATNLRRGKLAIANADIALDYRAGRGQATGSLRGEQGIAFTLAGNVGFSPDRITVAGGGTLAGDPVRLSAPAQFTRIADGWRLVPATLVLPDGQATLSGSFGRATTLSARLDAAGLELLNIFYPDLDVGGRVSGTLDAFFPANGALPQGRASLHIVQFTRAGSTATSLPVDLGISAAIQANAAALRAVVQRRGTVVGRMQAQIRPIPGNVNDPWLERLLASPLVAQLRWNGPAGALWPLTGIGAFDMRGPIAITANIGGHLGEPSLSGLMRSTSLRLESATLGTVVENLNLDGRFNDSRIELANLSGTTGKDGRIIGSGEIDLSAIRHFPMDIRLQLTNAQMLSRPDLRATATGPIHITNGAQGGRISGNLKIDRARFRIGRQAAEEIPELAVREKNPDLARDETPPPPPTIWRLDVNADADNRVEVDGMGLESEWAATLHLTGRADQPEIEGSARLIRGSYEFAGRRFEVTRGLLRFSGGYPPDPSMDIVAENSIQGLSTTLRIGGTAHRPEIAFSSVPALPEDEVLARVLFGNSITNLSAPEALQLAAAIASLRQGRTDNPLDVFNVLRRRIGIDRLRVLPGDTTTGRHASVAAGKYLGDRVYVEVASDAQGYTATQIEVELTRSLSILSQVATLGGTAVNLRWSKDY